MVRKILACLPFLLAACDEGLRTVPQAGEFRPMRIVSLDYCADQYVLKLVEPERILALSRDAAREFSYLRELAVGMPTVRPVAEDVLVLGPDLVVRSYGGGPNAAAFYARAGVAVLNVGNANTIDEVMSVMADVAAGLDEPERGQAVIEETRQRLASLPESGSESRTLYMTPGGVTTGPGSLVHEMLIAAGLQNFQQTPGWRPIPLELLAFEAPELVAFATFGASAAHQDAWSAMRHPIARTQLADREVVPLQGAWTACGGWFLLDAVEALARGATQ
ncbi:MAG: ABC transporter substrate-binding protein [Gammaproteobacteria bacterium]|nr:ABC transporter substrate-binding protein [Gammaproteobacteria bacterium]MDE0507978.1 ABC transporter substrate-binding protein [Gammaproteobacteria bacterium]MXY89907.1 ABC transporter substrate-binding protein [Gammaproteobacteria bacterium]MYF01374.1 ABC transporter substrate-binding protein [Gammaproteobacteria bacterium]MYG97763.1 ABC transporter substrate-binding protein [Gammaproteobacteria bacterium]